jgi:predicted nucleic acid-binding protein
VTYLLDVDALLALAHASHSLHRRVEGWVRSLRRADRLATTAITELGFVRIAPQTRLSPDVAQATELLLRLKRSRRFALLADAVGVDRLPAWVSTPAQITDGHLIAVASVHSARLATLDEGIPDAFLIP